MYFRFLAGMESAFISFDLLSKRDSSVGNLSAYSEQFLPIEVRNTKDVVGVYFDVSGVTFVVNDRVSALNLENIGKIKYKR